MLREMGLKICDYEADRKIISLIGIWEEKT